MTSWADQTTLPPQGPLFQAGLGGSPLASPGGQVASASGNTVAFAAAHGLAPGQGVACGDEIRFVASVVDSMAIQLNAPFTVTPGPGAATGVTATYCPCTELPSSAIYDYWSPASAVQRIVYGAAVNSTKIVVNGDYHEFQFSGVAADIADSSSFQAGQAGLSAFPGEPAISAGQFTVVPGFLGQVWLGAAPAQFFTLTAAQVTIDNGLDLRNREFGSDLARMISPGMRSVSLNFSLFQQDDSQTQQLYEAARQRSPIPVMLQLGEQPGQLCGIFMKNVTLEVPQFDDSLQRQQWSFSACRAQGTADDEVFIAFA